ncbi:hypothetical protein AD45P2_00215 [Alteromonas phage vB_AmaP_AD45-P2]|uniref:Uncharacterized protein n=2 Tax=Pseudomonadota TaxID=1224 RepID=A0A922NYK3_9HYPH|nr:hypothetical protein [Pseudorhizobium pelagicum]YP_008126015.1 hypothetical protein M610_gp044 [Alteromonas phage vB_AmaP_AD45-P1]AGM46982.1 hypothetical protein AD45P3_00220 [Alteromonas phage vB_AmaP_AD45-P3]AGM47099.1 hypothetical protein AD45P4_00220 [Alteromonas phage vB_AmaP_AD45-P4]AGM47214.1 hypothetical protein AD45P2_00215 [Alteromonas phage vB_AmaP_AD45-P2]AGM46862.1 hypothetical protein AD45P1_00220 [Alteromonas phage vB_AmaP_AD45-P1]KEQ05548.1 hypothetical protein GV68_08440 [
MRDAILEGNLPFPGTALFSLYPQQKDDIERFWKAIWLNFLNDSDTNGVYWYSELGSKLYNEVVRRLSHHGWVTSHAITARRWACVELNEEKLFEFITPDELLDVKTENKYQKYVLELREATASTLVRQNGETKRTGLVRKGFRDSGNTQFGYDMDALHQYEEAVKLNLTKSMDKIRQDYPEMKTTSDSYDNVSVGIYDWHYENKNEVFTTGNNINDSRGRAISSCLKKVANPISSKDFRAALVITYD